jgi:DUF1680 family protein
LFLLLLSGWLPCEAQTRFQTLPPQGIEVRGWMGQQIKEDAANGWVTICNRMSHQGIMLWDANTLTPVPYYLPPVKAFRGGREGWNRSVPYYQSFIDRQGSIGEGEYEAHWLDSLFRMGWIGGVPEFRELARQATKDILESRDASGYIGTNTPQVRFTSLFMGPFGVTWQGEVEGIMETLYAFLTYYRFTGDESVLKAAVKAADLTLERTQGKELWGNAGWDAPLGLIELCRVTGNRAYLDRARVMVDACLRGDPQVTTAIPQLVIGDGYQVRGHTAALGELLLAMAGIYQVTGDADMLAKARTFFEHVERYALQSHGAPTGLAEQLAPSSPRANTEGCDIIWFGMAWTEMLMATGEAHYADLVEKAALNALPGQRSKNGAVSPYFARPNQLFATRGSGMGTVYGARVFTECCHANLGRLLPVVAEHLVLGTAEGDFVIPFYNSSRFRGNSPKAGNVEILQETDYPFSEKVKITVRPERQPATFTVRLRVPGWCRGARVSINGEKTLVEAKESWIDLNRSWGASDLIELTLPMETRVKIDQDGLALVERGPLLYTLPVEGRRINVDRWGSFEELVTSDSKWNYALVLDKADPARSFTFRELRVAANAHVWEHPRVELEVEAVRVPEWKFDKDPALLIPSRTEIVPEPPFPSRPIRATGPKEKIRLVPYGCTILRMTQLPVVDVGI